MVIRNINRRLAAAVLCFAAACVEATAQDDGGRGRFALPGFVVQHDIGGAPAPAYMCDSLAFALHVKDIVPARRELPVWTTADSIALPPRLFTGLGGVAPAAAGTPFGRNPFAFDFGRSGRLASWGTGAVTGSSSRTTLPGLLSRRDASLGVVQSFGALTVSAGLSADRYMLWRGTRTTFGLGGSLSYRFTDNLSATLFGRYVGGGSFVSPASLPYVGASGYGGYVTLTGGALGVDLGVESYYDAFARRWVTSPIVTPKVRVSEKFTIELPVGWMVKEMIDNAVNNNRRRGGPMIMPDNVPAPGRIPFGAPEMPR